MELKIHLGFEKDLKAHTKKNEEIENVRVSDILLTFFGLI
jgi:hypothetical protein